MINLIDSEIETIEIRKENDYIKLEITTKCDKKESYNLTKNEFSKFVINSQKTYNFLNKIID